MITYSRTKRLLSTDFSNVSDIDYLRKTSVELWDAYCMSALYVERGLTKEAIERGFVSIVQCDQATGFSPKDIFMPTNIKTALDMIDRRILQLTAQVPLRQ